MAGVAGYEDARRACADLLLRHVVKLVAKSLADLVDRPPCNLLYLKGVGMLSLAPTLTGRGLI